MTNEEIEEFKEKIAAQVLQERGYALVWMSAGNSYFTEEIIKKILGFTSEHFLKTIVMAPDEPAEHTFRALGYEGNDIKRKARLNANLLQNRAKRIIASFEKDKFHVIEWIDEVIPNSLYQEKLKEITSLYHNNREFKLEADETTKKVLATKMKEAIDLEEAIKEGVHYLLKELAFVLASPDIFGVERMSYVYHHPWPIFQKLIAGLYDGKPKPELKFVLFK